MTRRQNRFIAIAPLTMILLASVYPRQAAAQNPNQPPSPVSIVNPLPVPVTGVVEVGNNTPASPLFVSDADRGRLLQRVGDAFDIRVSWTVPPGERWIIEHVSGHFRSSDAVEAFGLQKTIIGSLALVTDWLVPVQTTPTVAITNAQTKFIVNAGEQVSLIAFGSFPGFRQMIAFISGTIVPAP